MEQKENIQKIIGFVKFNQSIEKTSMKKENPWKNIEENLPYYYIVDNCILLDREDYIDETPTSQISQIEEENMDKVQKIFQKYYVQQNSSKEQKKLN